MPDEEKVEFRGVSVSRDKRNAIVLFVIEAIVVLLFIAGVLFVLNYFEIINLSAINSRLFSILPVREETIEKLEAKSENSEYKLVITDPSSVINFLTEMGFYDERFSQQTGEVFVPSGIVVILTDKEQSGVPIFNTVTGIMSHSASITPITDTNQLEFRVYLAPDLFENENINPSENFHYHFTFTAYKFFNQQAPLDRVENDLKIYNQNIWFKIEKL